MKSSKNKSKFSKFMDYAFFSEFANHPSKCFFASLAYNWGLIFLLSFIFMGLLTAITGGDLLWGMFLFALVFGGGQIVYPFIAFVMRGSEESYGFSYGFYYGTLGLCILIQKMNIIESSETILLISTVIAALVCYIVYLQKKINN